MKKELTKQFVLDNKGCYSLEQANAMSFMNKDKFNVLDIVKSEIPLKDKYWFVTKKLGLTIKENQEIAIAVAKIVLVIYEAKYPDNKAPCEAIEAAEAFIAGSITILELRKKRNAAAYAAAAAAAAAAYAADDAAAAAAAAAAYAAYAAADDAYAAADAAAAYAAYAAYAAVKSGTKSGEKYTKALLACLIKFVKKS